MPDSPELPAREKTASKPKHVNRQSRTDTVDREV